LIVATENINVQGAAPISSITGSGAGGWTLRKSCAFHTGNQELDFLNVDVYTQVFATAQGTVSAHDEYFRRL
jgi:hypothetical protein